MSITKSLRAALSLLGASQRGASLYSMNEAELARRGFDRAALVRGYVASLGAR